MTTARRSTEPAWPPLPLAAWRDTLDTLHMWTQVVGKTRLALAPMENHWWQCTLHVTERGLTTTPMPDGTRLLSVDFDFVDHLLVLRTGDGERRPEGALPLLARPLGVELVGDVGQHHPLGRSSPGVLARLLGGQVPADAGALRARQRRLD